MSWQQLYTEFVENDIEFLDDIIESISKPELCNSTRELTQLDIEYLSTKQLLSLLVIWKDTYLDEPSNVDNQIAQKNYYLLREHVEKVVL